MPQGLVRRLKKMQVFSKVRYKKPRMFEDFDANEFLPWNVIVEIYKVKNCRNYELFKNGGKNGGQMGNDFETGRKCVQS
jgi:hypothetical protein